MVAFFANMMFVVLARTSLVYMPVLLALFCLRHLGARAALALVAVAAIVTTGAWFTSSYMRVRINDVSVEYKQYNESHVAKSTGQRIEWWGKSIKFIGAAPVFGNGTGSIRELFERDSGNAVGIWAEPVRNPHNQTLNVAIQWGFCGFLILYAMWFSHVLLFPGRTFVAWIGLIVVVQNFVSSLFNSHLFDFTEGWIYVIGVGVAGGMIAKTK